MKSSRCPFGKIRSVGSDMGHWSLGAAEVMDDFSGVFTPSMGAGRSGFEVAQRASRRRHTLAIPDAALSAYFNFQDRLDQIFVVYNCDIPELKPLGLVGRAVRY